MPISTVPKSGKRGVTVKIKDGAGNSLTVPHNDDFTWDFSEDAKITVMEGGQKVIKLRGDEAPVTGSFSINMRGDTSATAAAVLDIVYFRNYVASNWTPTNGVDAAAKACGQVPEWTIEETVCGTDVGDTADHVTTLTEVNFTSVSKANGDKITQTINFEAWGFAQS